MRRPPIDSQITFLTVADLGASSEFYGELLGLEMVLDQGTCRIFQVTSTAYLGACTHREDANPEGVIVTLVSDHVDQWYQNLVAAGAEFESRPELNADFNIYHAFLRDPDGHLVEIQQFMDPTWKTPLP